MSAEQIAALEAAMTAAAARDDFEEAARLRNALFVARGGGTGSSDGEADGADYAGLQRQRPGAMGIGSQHPRPDRPAGWTPPTKPPSLTARTGRRGKR